MKEKINRSMKMYIVKLIRNLFIFQLYNIYVNEEYKT